MLETQGVDPIALAYGRISFIIVQITEGGIILNNYHPFIAYPHGSNHHHGFNHHVDDQRFVPGLGLGLGFLGGLATGALITPGPGYGYGYPQYPYPYPYQPYPYYGYPYSPYYR